MWPFKKKEKTETFEEIQEKQTNEKIDTLSEKFPLGSAFEYLGVRCLVTSTRTMSLSKYKFLINAELKADYVDKNGVIHELALNYSEAMRIVT